mmetsp:Transcript_29715/g.95062  ORF Transcript_29715/g.95062 Transcript_29715/m.95062 type:complete len:208 (+) Transcript_29715:90-713(+)
MTALLALLVIRSEVKDFVRVPCQEHLLLLMVDEAHLIVDEISSCCSLQASMSSDAHPHLDRILHHHPQPSRLCSAVVHQRRKLHPPPAIDALGVLEELGSCPGLWDVPADGSEGGVEGAEEGAVAVAGGEALGAALAGDPLVPQEAIAGSAAAQALPPAVADAVERGDGAAERGCLTVGDATAFVQPANFSDLAHAVAAHSAPLNGS